MHYNAYPSVWLIVPQFHPGAHF